MKSLSICFGLLFLSSVVLAGSPVEIHVTVGKVSEAVFPEKVARVVKGGAADSVLVEVLDNTVYLLPKSYSPADVFVTGVSGESYPLNLVISSEHDVRINAVGDVSSKNKKMVKADVMELMKEILLGHEPAGALLLKSKEKTFLSDQQINIEIDAIYDFYNMTAYVLTAHNLTQNSVVVPLQQVSFPGLAAAASDQDILMPKGEDADRTKMYLIAVK
jgi:hypothetical protein